MIIPGLAVTAGETLLRVSPWTVLGDAMFACAGLQWALYATLARHWRIAPMTAAACMTMLSGAIFAPPYLLGDGPARLLALPPAMGAGAGARVLFPAALARLPRQDGRAAVTLRLAMLTGWAPGG